MVYRTEKEKYFAVADEIRRCSENGQPVLVGTTSIEKSERISDLLKKKGVKHVVLNAKYHEHEAEIVAQAGRMGMVTIATNMAGRGTDILLGGNAEFMAQAGDGEEGNRAAAACSRRRGRAGAGRRRDTSSSITRAMNTVPGGQMERDLRQYKQQTDAEHDEGDRGGRTAHPGHGAARSRGASTISCAGARAARAILDHRVSSCRWKTT